MAKLQLQNAVPNVLGTVFKGAGQKQGQQGQGATATPQDALITRWVESSAALARRRKNSLRENRLHQVAKHIGEPKIAAAEAIGEAFVVDAEQVQDRRV